MWKEVRKSCGGGTMSVPDEYSTYCDFECGSYNVRGYCEHCLVEFFNWIKKTRKTLTEDNFEDLMEEFANRDK